MRKFTLAFVLVALMPFVSASAYENKYSESTSYKTRPATSTNSYKRASTSRKTGGYKNVITNNFYYNQSVDSYVPQQQTSYKSTNRSANNYKRAEKKESVKRTYSSQERKFFLANPFFQPLEGRFGSVTDFSYAHNKFDFDVFDGTVYGLNPNHDPIYGYMDPVLSGKSETSQFAIKEDISFGLTDNLSLVVMGQYDSTKSEFKDWSNGASTNSKSSSGLNLFGAGLQGRFVDNEDWIVMAEAFFQHQKDAANTFMGALKAGYKVGRTTIYGTGRVAYSHLIDGDAYGVYVDDSTGDWLMFSYNTSINDILQVEGGLGAFAVLNKYLTLNGEVMYGHYDWHDQLNVKGAFGIQPGDNFALNIYASATLYDSAKDKIRRYMSYDLNPTDYPKNPMTGNPVYTDSKILYTTGDYKIKNYNEWKVGVQAILYF